MSNQASIAFLTSLKEPQVAADYLKAMLELGHTRVIALALRNIAEANNINLYSSSGEP